MDQGIDFLQETKKHKNSTEPFASVIIVTRNRAGSLDRALKAVTSLEYPNYEVLIVDNDSSDETKEVIARYGATRIFVPSQHGIGYCRRKGVATAKGEYVAFCDDDCVPRPDWLTQFVERLKNERDLGIVGGQVINVGFSDEMQNKGRSRHWKNGKLQWVEDPHDAEFYGNMNLGFRREVVDKVGNYDPFFNVMAEIDLQVRIRKNGYRVDYEPAAILEHHYTGINYKKRHARGGAQLVRLYFCMKHYRPKTFREWVTFLGCEMSFFWKDLKRIFQGFGSSVVHLKLQRWPELLKALFQAVSSRLAIPWLIWRANRDRLALAAE